MAQAIVNDEVELGARVAGGPVSCSAEGHGGVAVPPSGPPLLHRLSGVADHPRSVAELHELPASLGQAGAMGRLRQLCAGASRPAHVGEPGPCGSVHHHVPARNDYPSLASRNPRRPGREPTARHALPRHPAHSGGHSEHADLRAVEVDVQLSERPDQPSPGQYVRALHLQNAPQWLGGTPLTLPAIAIMEVWWGLGYHTIFFIAGLAAIPKECRTRRASTAPTSGRCSGT